MRRRRQSGFALLLIFAMMSAAAVLVYMQVPRFVMQSQRAKEQLLIDRGEQYQRAIQLYYRKLKTWPQSLDDLEKGNNMRFLRRKYKDPFTGKAECDAGTRYRASLPTRFKKEAANLSWLTGWKQSEIEARMEVSGQSVRGVK